MLTRLGTGPFSWVNSFKSRIDNTLFSPLKHTDLLEVLFLPSVHDFLNLPFYQSSCFCLWGLLGLDPQYETLHCPWKISFLHLLQPKPSSPENIFSYSTSSTVTIRLTETAATLFSYFSNNRNELAFLVIYLQERQKPKKKKLKLKCYLARKQWWKITNQTNFFSYILTR